MAIHAEVGGNMLLHLLLSDGVAGLFPQAEVEDTGGTPIAGSPFDLTDLGGGSYALHPSAPAAGDYIVTFKTYTDAGHTTLSTAYRFKDEQVFVRDATADAVWDAAKTAHTTAGTFGEAVIAAAGHAGLHAVLDGGSGSANAPHNSNNNLTSARLRIFKDKVDADAATLGAADAADGELLRLNVDLASYVAGSVTVSPEVLASMRRTSA